MKSLWTNDLLNQVAFEVWPNPAKELVNIRIDEFKAAFVSELELLTIDGKSVKTVKYEGSAAINVSTINFSNGLYVIRLLDENANIVGSKKISVQQ